MNISRPIKCGAWTNESLHQALDAISDEGMKMRTTSKVFGIPSFFLKNHLYGRTTSR